MGNHELLACRITHGNREHLLFVVYPGIVSIVFFSMRDAGSGQSANAH